MVNRAVERGESPKGTDVDLLAELVGGALYYRSVVGATTIDEPAIERFVDVALRGLGAHPSEPPRGSAAGIEAP